MVCQFLKKLKIYLPYSQITPILHVYLREMKVCSAESLVHKYKLRFIHNNQNLETDWCQSREKCLNNPWYISVLL